MVLLIDNYDSFTYNLFDYIHQLGYAVKVIRNDQFTLEEVELLQFDSIVISPGPGIPQEAGFTMAIIDKFYSKKPILGICLGHQALGIYFDAKLIKAAVPKHGKTSAITTLNSKRLFCNLEQNLVVMRYHSLILDNVKTPLRVVATTSNNEVMAFEHESLPIAGVQFHPESILTNSGLSILKNWFNSIK